MTANVSSPREPLRATTHNRNGLPMAVCLFALVLTQSFFGLQFDLWFPFLGIGLACTFAFGLRFPAFLAAGLFAFQAIMFFVEAVALETPLQQRIWLALSTDVLVGLELAGAFTLYHLMAGGSSRLGDPRSAVLFLIMVPMTVAASGAAAELVVLQSLDLGNPQASISQQFGALWLRAMLGFLVVGPFCMIVLVPLAERLGWIDSPEARRRGDRWWTFGESLELVGLALGNLLLAFIQVRLQRQNNSAAWPLWGISLLLVVWSSIRQGLRGGVITAFAGSALALTYATSLKMSPAAFSPLQGNLLAQCGIALLVGAAVIWIRATEARYRHVVGHIPLVLTSVRLNHSASLLPEGVPVRSSIDSKPDFKSSGNVLRDAEIVLVSNASMQILGVAAERLVGPFYRWLEIVHPDDHEIVIAAISQLSLERQPVTCEYRVTTNAPSAVNNVTAPTEAAPPARWVRDTLAPHYTGDGRLDGWDGVVEEITDQRTLQQENRRIAGMLQALVANMPTGVFFVQGPSGHAILVNARARQLLGQREDVSAGLVHLSEVYRLHRQDGSLYPVDELPVAKALRYGQTCTANDIIVYRPDGRRVPLFTWAAPIDLGKVGRPEAAVWVLEDLSALQQAEFARRESEARLRAVFETLAEGVVVQNRAGVIIEGNPAAASILGVSIDEIVGRSWIGPDRGCLRDDGTPCPADQQPDRVAMQIKMPVRNVVFGLPRATGEIRWVVVNSMPLPVGTAFAPNTKNAQLVTTFADISAERQAQRNIANNKEKYQTLVETLPVIVLQLDVAGRVGFMNPAAQTFIGATAGDFGEPGSFEALFDDADRPRVSIALQEAGHGKDSRFEFGLRSKTGEPKIGLALVHPIRQDGKAAGSAWIVVDMTRQRRLEEELVKSQRLELVGRLASGTVHDFNNLMTSVIGTASVLKAEMGDRPETAADLDLIERTATHAQQLLAQILSLGKNPVRPTQSLDLNQIIHATLGLLKNVIPANVRIQTHLAAEPLTVAADDLQLKQVILNLCLNARDAMPDGGTMTITSRADRLNSYDWAVIAVEDTGHGVPDHVREQMFEPFFTTKERGTGIGLSVVRDIVQRLGGTIDVWSEDGSGTRFEIGLRMTK